MRSFEERKNEILRRSEELIQKNKVKRNKINRIIYTCIPCFAVLLITATLVGGYISDSMGGDYSSDMSPSLNESAKFETSAEEREDLQLKDEADMPHASDSKLKSYIRIYYSESDSYDITDESVVNSINSIFDSSTIPANEATANSKFPEENDDTKTTNQDAVLPESSESNTQDVYITSYKSNGTIEKYIYKYPILENCDTGERFTLTREVGQKLKQLIKK